MREKPWERERLDSQLDASCGGPEEAQALRRCLALYALPPEEPGAAEAFWARLQPRLTSRKPDAALCLTPLILAAGHTLWQVLSLILGALALAGFWPVLAARVRLNLAPAAFADLWPLPALRLWLRPVTEVIPPSWMGSLGLAGLLAAGWAVLLTLALFYGAWMFLWLQPSRPAQRM